MALFRRPGSGRVDGTDQATTAMANGTDVEVADDLPPSRMRKTEPLYGYVVGLELLVVAVLNMTVTGGKGAPAHPQTGLQLVGIVASLAFFAVLQLRNRTIVGFAAIVDAFFVTLPRVPNSLGVAHVLALAIPLGYGLIITQRQRRAMGNATRGRRRAEGGRRAGTSPAPESRRRRRAAKTAPQPTGPQPSARYTPPKSKRGKARR